MRCVTGWLCAGLLFSGSVFAEERLPGFLGEGSKAEIALEAKYESLLDADNLRGWMKEMTTRPHHLGAPKTKENAELIAELFRSWGYDTEIEVFYVLFPTPKHRKLTLNKPTHFEADLNENIFAPGSDKQALLDEGLPPFNAYSADGRVTGNLVYVNEGLPRDYEVLAQHGIDVRGNIVIAQYGGSWRGIKPKVAAEMGAIGCIIYNEPQDDGYGRGDAYPEGAYKHDSAVQRGSIYDLPRRPGDPLTPGVGSTRDAPRIAMKDAETLMTIPVLPISSGNAIKLLSALGGAVVPASWRGALPISYRFGGQGISEVTLEAEFNWEALTPTYNVIATLKGSEFPDEWVMRGNHHDAWVIGASDPMSGLVAMLEQARAISELVKDGWKPKRTIKFCAWDGEEPGLLGSTEWVEHHADDLDEHAVVYINTDGNSRGFFSIGGSHALEPLAASVAHAVTDPQTGVSISERRRSASMVRGDAKAKKAARGSRDLPLSALGSGSDYSAFLQHAGIASFNVGFGGEGVGGEYHTSFDTFDHYTRFKDPKLEYGVALANVCGRLTMRLADADILPFAFSSTAKTIERYVDEIVSMADERREEAEQFNDLVDDD
ncbi:MAG: M28 family peptidase, partial [Candidatus Hydrogenedentota bacterium]